MQMTTQNLCNNYTGAWTNSRIKIVFKVAGLNLLNSKIKHQTVWCFAACFMSNSLEFIKNLFEQ